MPEWLTLALLAAFVLIGGALGGWLLIWIDEREPR